MLNKTKPEAYELATCQTIEGLHRDDVLEAVRIWHCYAPAKLDPTEPSVDELDAMARAFAAMLGARDRRQAEAREHEARAEMSARETADLLETRRRTHARHAENLRGSRLS